MSSAKFGTWQRGSRSAPPFRLIPGVTDLPYDTTRDVHKCLNDQAAVMIQIESKLGVDNLDAILTECPDIDIVWFGSLDCRVSMNFPSNMGLGGTEPEWIETSEKFYATLKKHDKPLGGFAFATPPFGTPEGITKAAQTMSFIGVTADVLHLAALGQDLAQARQLTALPSKEVTKEANGTKIEGNGVASGESVIVNGANGTGRGS
jgi:4-hydroxy-2-oxoheptanedioate aldolase